MSSINDFHKWKLTCPRIQLTTCKSIETPIWKFFHHTHKTFLQSIYINNNHIWYESWFGSTSNASMTSLLFMICNLLHCAIHEHLVFWPCSFWSFQSITIYYLHQHPLLSFRLLTTLIIHQTHIAQNVHCSLTSSVPTSRNNMKEWSKNKLHYIAQNVQCSPTTRVPILRKNVKERSENKLQWKRFRV
jgi:hypothetical protein